tara:strand:+ start:5191 stop:5535 length:345 start_codon:yes stop_codon:yes gene_type:complete
MSWRAATHPAQLVLGLVIWCCWFVLLYAGLALTCAATSGEEGWLTWTLLTLLIITGGCMLAGLLLCCARRCWMAAASARGESLFIARVAAAVYLLAAAASIALVLPSLVYTPCV